MSHLIKHNYMNWLFSKKIKIFGLICIIGDIAQGSKSKCDESAEIEKKEKEKWKSPNQHENNGNKLNNRMRGYICPR